MKPTKAPVKLLTLHWIVIICRAEFHIGALTPNESAEQLVEAAVGVIKTCYRTETIGIGGNPTNSLISSLSNGEFPASVVLLNGATRIVDSGVVPRISRHKLQHFLIRISSSMELEKILAEIKKSRWWNHMANFYMLGSPMSDDGCSRAHEVLSTAWKMNLLEAKFMCIDERKRRMIYSFNPYTSDAPEPWKVEKIYRGKNEHPWALLVREYRNHRNVCGNMDFDKTKDLGGYGIRVTVIQEVFIRAVVNKTGVDAIGGIYGHLVQKIFHTLNASVAELKVHTLNETVGVVDGNGKANGIVAEVVNGITDIGIFNLNILTVANATQTYPFTKGGLSVMTHYTGYKSQLSKFVSVIDGSSRIGVCLVILVTVIFMKYFLRQNLSTAILNTMRLICNSSLLKLPITVGPRIYLSSLFLCVITIVGIYQGQLASLLSKRILLPNIDSMLDLAKSDYTIYGNHRLKQLFSDRPFEGRFVGIDGWNCTKYVLRHPSSAACVTPQSDLIYDAARFKLHVSKHLIVKYEVVYVIREDWPLEKKINELLQGFAETHLFRYSSLRKHEKIFRTIETNRNEDQNGEVRVLTLSDLSFVFAILAVGLGFASLCFIIEMVMHKRETCSWIVRIRAVCTALFRS